ncbi:MAG: hypothetical protein IMF20_00450 [Proteobacteria bacterium]|nr:hypothetical protein [Pseudomonadota bacterium]
MRKFTDAELGLAPKVAEVMGHEPRLEGLPKDMLSAFIRGYLSEHDCLEWLREKGWLIEHIHNLSGSGSWYVRVGKEMALPSDIFPKFSKIAPELLEALYRCIVEIGKGGDDA